MDILNDSMFSFPVVAQMSPEQRKEILDELKTYSWTGLLFTDLESDEGTATLDIVTHVSARYLMMAPVDCVIDALRDQIKGTVQYDNCDPENNEWEMVCFYGDTEPMDDDPTNLWAAKKRQIDGLRKLATCVKVSYAVDPDRMYLESFHAEDMFKPRLLAPRKMLSFKPDSVSFGFGKVVTVEIGPVSESFECKVTARIKYKPVVDPDANLVLTVYV